MSDTDPILDGMIRQVERNKTEMLVAMKTAAWRLLWERLACVISLVLAMIGMGISWRQTERAIDAGRNALNAAEMLDRTRAGQVRRLEEQLRIERKNNTDKMGKVLEFEFLENVDALDLLKDLRDAKERRP